MFGICNTAKRLVCWDLKKSCRAVLKRSKSESSLPGCNNEGLISVLWGGRKAGFYLRHQLPQLALKKSDWSALHVTKECCPITWTCEITRLYVLDVSPTRSVITIRTIRSNQNFPPSPLFPATSFQAFVSLCLDRIQQVLWAQLLYQPVGFLTIQ